MFINFSNHPSKNWSKEQTEQAQQYGKILDIPFPNVPPTYTKSQISTMAKKCVGDILEKNPKCVLCQGEFSLAYTVINLLKERDIKVVTACSERNVTEIITDGKYSKPVVFEFVGFREY